MRFNKKGDRGYTSLLYGHRVPKHNPRTEAYGVLDEANSALGLARAATRSKKIKEVILSLQKDIFVIGAELATLPADYDKLAEKMTHERCQRLEDLIEEFEGKVELPNVFTIPGDSLASAALDLARATVRRAERTAVRLKHENIIHNVHILGFLNRLADLLYTIARYEDARAKSRSGGKGKR